MVSTPKKVDLGVDTLIALWYNTNIKQRMENMNSATGQVIYLDRNQCERVGAEYLKKHLTALKAKDLIETKKGDGYDDFHMEVLNGCGEKYIVLERHSGEKPGWYTITKVVNA